MLGLCAEAGFLSYFFFKNYILTGFFVVLKCSKIILRNVVDSIQAINGQNADKIIGLTLFVCFSELRTLKPTILSAFWPFIDWMESIIIHFSEMLP